MLRGRYNRLTCWARITISCWASSLSFRRKACQNGGSISSVMTLDHRNIVLLHIPAPVPKAPARRADEAGHPAELVGQFLQEFFEARLRYGLAVARSRGQEDLHEVRYWLMTLGALALPPASSQGGYLS